MEQNVFNRTSDKNNPDKISANLYNLIIGLSLAWGFIINWHIVTTIDTQSLTSIHPIIFFGGYFLSCFAGVYLFNKSHNPIVSFCGYNLVVIPFGLILNVVIAGYDQNIVSEAIAITGAVTVLMMILGTLYPAFFSKIHRALTIALISVIIVELVAIFIFKRHHELIDWAVVIIFCGYIGFDWGRANQIPKTVDNAIDSSAALYIDIINLFIRILRILGRRK